MIKHRLSMPHLPKLMFLTTLTIVALVALVSSDPSAPTYGHSTSGNGNHIAWIISLTKPVTFYSLNVIDSASTSENKSGSAMVTNVHTNSAYVHNGKCGAKYFPFCFTAWSDPKIEYSHETNDYTLTSWDVDTCIFPPLAHAKCFISDTSLAWFSWPLDADGKRTVGIYHSEKYSWLPLGSIKTFGTPTYQVD